MSARFGTCQQVTSVTAFGTNPWSVAVVVFVLTASCHRDPPLPLNASWNPSTGTFTWWAGQVSLPPGYSYRVDVGADTFEGHFTSRDRKTVIRHDIGSYAGARAARAQALSFEEKIIDGVRVWTAKRDTAGGSPLLAVTFPDSGCANFFVDSARRDDEAVIERIAASFRPAAKRQDADPRCR